MEEIVVLLIVFFIVLATIAIPFIWGLIPDNDSIYKRDYSKIAIYISALVIIGFVVAHILKIVMNESGLDWSHFIILSIVPVATIAGFYMVYQTFKVQSENAIKQEIHNLIKLQNRILGEIELVEKDLSSAEPDNDKKYVGRAAFKKILEDFNDSFISFKKLWDAFILLSIKVNSTQLSNVSIEAEEKLNGIFSEDGYDDKATKSFIVENYDLFTEKVVLDKFLKTLHYKELLVSVLYIRLYFDEKTGDRYLKQKFDFKGTSLKSYISKLYDIPDTVKLFTNKNDDILTYTSPFSGGTESNVFIRHKASGSNVSKWLNDFYPEDLLTKSKENSQDLHLYLDTYFRNLFSAYKTVAKIKNKKLKADSARLLRTQVSSYEQAVIFLNSLSPMGKKWQKVGDLNLFRDLNVLKNIPENVIQHIQPWEVYKEEGFDFEYKTKK